MSITSALSCSIVSLTPPRPCCTFCSMKSMLMHSFVLDALDTTGADTFSHFEMLIDEHREMTNQLLQEINSNPNIQTSSQKSINVNSALQPMPNMVVPSRLKQLVPSIGTFYTRLPLRKAFEAYNLKYGITKRRYVINKSECCDVIIQRDSLISATLHFQLHLYIVQ